MERRSKRICTTAIGLGRGQRDYTIARNAPRRRWQARYRAGLPRQHRYRAAREAKALSSGQLGRRSIEDSEASYRHALCALSRSAAGSRRSRRPAAVRFAPIAPKFLQRSELTLSAMSGHSRLFVLHVSIRTHSAIRANEHVGFVLDETESRNHA